MPVAVVEAAVAGGVDAVHLRDREAAARAVFARGRELQAALDGQAWLVVNDRLDVALALGADGAQLGGGSLAVDDARRVAPRLPLGVSVHSAPEAQAAERAGADWVVLGTIYPSRSHPGQPGAGPGLIGAAREMTRCPLIAIGGITPENADPVLAVGADGVAVITAITAAPSPRDAARRLRERIDTRYPR